MGLLVSVIVPIYKVEEYLPRCLDSIIGQTYQNLEIILVDDGSPDSCGAICDRYSAQDNRIRVIHQKNQGVSAARNAGLDAMTGDCLMFVDPDDFLSREAVRLMYDRMIRDGSELVIGEAVKVWQDGKTEKEHNVADTRMRFSSDQMLQFLTGRGTISCFLWCKLYRSRIFDDLRFPDISRAEDVWILPHIVEKCKSISTIPDVIYYYFQRETSIVHTSGDAEHLDSISASLHVARVLYDNRLITNSGAYYYSAVKEGRKVRNKTKMEQLLKESFAEEERKQIGRKFYVHWRLFLPDKVYLCLRKMKRFVTDGVWMR